MIRASLYVPDFFVQAYLYRDYLLQSVVRDLKTKYKRSSLGYVWAMLHPLAMMTILAAVFSSIMRIPVQDYAVFLFCGLLPFNFFSSTVMMSLGSIRANARLFSQVPVPKYLFILSLVASNFFNYVLALVPMFLLMLILGRDIPLTIFAFPIVVLPLIFVTIGVSLILATSNVFFEDTLHLSEVGLQALYFLCPILYFRAAVPEELANTLVLTNPLFTEIEFLRGIFYDGTLPEALPFLCNLGGSSLILLLGLLIFRRSEEKFLYFI